MIVAKIMLMFVRFLIHTPVFYLTNLEFNFKINITFSSVPWPAPATLRWPLAVGSLRRRTRMVGYTTTGRQCGRRCSGAVTNVL